MRRKKKLRRIRALEITRRNINRCRVQTLMAVLTTEDDYTVFLEELSTELAKRNILVYWDKL